MLRLVQFKDEMGGRRIGLPVDPTQPTMEPEPGDAARYLKLVMGFGRIYDLAFSALRAGQPLETYAQEHLGDEIVDYGRIVSQGRLLPPLDHPDEARCLVSLTGLTHTGSARSRDEMHAVASDATTDSLRMFRLGLEGGKPEEGRIGAQPEWAYKGDGRCVVAPGKPITRPGFAEDGGEEAEIVGLYVIDDHGLPRRVGYAIGNEFADHLLERRNYLYLAPSKLRQCSFGPELLIGELPESVTGTVRVMRGEEPIWSAPFLTGEANMCHSLANLEHHHFKYASFRRPGDVHVHFFGANAVSFGADIRPQEGDAFEIDVPLFGRPLRNPLRCETENPVVRVEPV